MRFPQVQGNSFYLTMCWGAANSHWFSREIETRNLAFSSWKETAGSCRLWSQHQHTYSFREAAHSEIQRGTTFCEPEQPSTSQYWGSPTPSIPSSFSCRKEHHTHKKISSLYLTLLGFGPKEELVEQKCKLTLWRSAWDSTRQFFCTHKNHIKSVQALKRTSSSFSQIMSLTG